MTLLTLLLALALDAFVGDPPNRFHPVVAMGTYIRWVEAHAPKNGNAQQFIYGMLMIVLGIGLFTVPLIALQVLLQPLPWLLVIINAALLKTTFSMRRLLEAGKEVETALAQNNLPEARRLVSWHLVSRDTSTLGEGHVASAAAESLAENLPDSFIAPLLAFAIGGLPLAVAYRLVNTADAMIGYHDPKHEYTGKFAARFDDVLNWIPSRLGGLFITLAGPLASGSLGNALRIMWTQHNRTASPNAGWPMSAAAGALGVTLEKINHYTLEGGPALPTVANLRSARRLVLNAAILSSLMLVVACLDVTLVF